MPTSELESILAAVNGSRRTNPAADAGAELRALQEQAQKQPQMLIKEVLENRRRCDQLQHNCATSAEAAENAARLIENLLSGHAILYPLETLRETPAGTRAVCRVGDQTREFSLHPEVDVEALQRLQPWEFVCVHENVVIGVWADDPALFEIAQGEIVGFQGYHGDDRRQARVIRAGNVEDIVRLTPDLCLQTLTSGSKLVLMRHDPRWAIDSLPANEAISRFEVPIDEITTRFSDLACMEPVAEKLMLETFKRVIRPEIRDEFNLDPLRGLILYSYKPGMGKTALVRAFAHEINELGQEAGFDVVLYVVKPNEFKSMWHGEDSRIVRELFGAIRQRRCLPRSRPLLQILTMDEIDSLGRRPEGGERLVSSAQSDALEAFLAEADGMQQEAASDPPAHLIIMGMTNRPERLDDAIKRPGRLGDEMIEIPDLDREGAEEVCLIYLRAASIPWSVDGDVRVGLPPDEVARRFLRPAMAHVFPTVVLRYATDNQKKHDVTAGQIMAAVHYRKAMTVAKNQAAERRLRGTGTPAILFDDVVEGLLETSLSLAAQMEADPHMLMRHLKIKLPIARIDVTPRAELEHYRFVETH